MDGMCLSHTDDDMQLRDYQSKALEAISGDINTPGASIVVMPTGAGKSHVIAAAALLKRPVLILVPSQELLTQNRDKLGQIIPESEIGIYSASFNQREIREFTFATIQSVYKKPELFQHIELVLLDECHQLNPKELGMYASFLSKIGSPKVIGLTASPFRLALTYIKKGNDLYAQTGIKMINRMRNKNNTSMFWKRIIFTISHRKLIDEGYIVPIKYIHEPVVPYESIPVNVSHSDFNLESYSQTIIGFESNILRTIAQAKRNYGSILVFCADVDQADRLASIVKGSACVTGKTPKKERERIIGLFKKGDIQTVFNVGCLTTGFDHPTLDCIVLLRPVRSPILYMQMLGRITRPAPGKEYGIVIDLTGSCKHLGEIESFEVFLNNGQWDIRSSKVNGFHGKILFDMKL